MLLSAFILLGPPYLTSPLDRNGPYTDAYNRLDLQKTESDIIFVGSSTHAFGLQANSSGTYATAIGRGSGVTATSVGTGSTAIGGSYASGSDSLAAAIANNTSTYGATGTSSIAMGYLAKASGNFATAI